MTESQWLVVASGLSAAAAAFAAWAALQSNQLARQNTEAALVKERARIISELEACFVEIGSGTEPVPTELLTRLRTARQEAALIFPPDAVGYINELVSMAWTYAQAADRDLVTAECKLFNYAVAVFQTNIGRWTNPYLPRPSWVDVLKNRYFDWRLRRLSRPEAKSKP